MSLLLGALQSSRPAFISVVITGADPLSSARARTCVPRVVRVAHVAVAGVAIADTDVVADVLLRLSIVEWPSLQNQRFLFSQIANTLTQQTQTGWF